MLASYRNLAPLHFCITVYSTRERRLFITGVAKLLQYRICMHWRTTRYGTVPIQVSHQRWVNFFIHSGACGFLLVVNRKHTTYVPSQQ